MNRLTKSQAALLNALDRYELKQATLSDLQRDTGLTIRGCRQIAFALEDRSMIAMEGRKCSLTFAGMQAISESPRFITAAELKVFAQERITKKEFYDLGGFANSDLFRKQSRGGAWRYYRALDNRE